MSKRNIGIASAAVALLVIAGFTYMQSTDETSEETSTVSATVNTSVETVPASTESSTENTATSNEDAPVTLDNAENSESANSSTSTGDSETK